MPRDKPTPQDNGQPPEQRLSALDRAVQLAIGGEQKVGLTDDPLALSCPELWRWLTQINWGRDHIVTPAVITMRAGPEGMIAAVTHRDLGMSAEVCVPYAADCLKALEEAISGPHARVRTWGRQQGRLRKRRSQS